MLIARIVARFFFNIKKILFEGLLNRWSEK